MDFPFGQTIYRDRRARIVDPFDPDRTLGGDWDPSLTVLITNAWVATSSPAVMPPDATREEILEAKSLFCGDPSADVRPGDRIRADGEEPLYAGRGAADRNPFTGWQPVAEYPLKGVEG